jgi:tetratricopeptide (TPR) repeat protein
MLTKDMKKADIEEILKDKGDFIQIDYLDRFIKDSPPIDMKRFAYEKLARIYLDRNMFENAALMFKNVAINSITFKEQQENYIKEAKCYIRAGRFDEVQNALKKAFAEANKKDRRKMYDEVVAYYKKTGEDYEKARLPGKSISLYEKLIRMKLTVEDKTYVRDRLIELYQKLGRTKDYNFLKSMKIA